VVARWQSSTLARAFAGWRGRVGGAAAKAEALVRAVRLWANMALAKGWSSWKVSGQWPVASDRQPAGALLPALDARCPAACRAGQVLPRPRLPAALARL
jgi:hypothetical protein